MLTTVTGYANNTDSSIELIPRWKKGDKLQYTMIKTRLKYKSQTTILKTKFTSPVTIEVIEANDEGYLISWTTGEAVAEDPAQASDPLVKLMTNLMKDYKILLEMDSYATIIGVRNWKDLQKTARDTLQVLRQSMKDSGMDSATIEKICAQVEPMYAAKEQIEMFCTREPQLFFLTLGRSYSLSESIDYQDRLPNPFGGDPFPSQASFVLEKADAASDMAVVRWEQQIDPVAGAQVLEKTIREMAKRMGKPIPEGDVLNSLSITDSATFTHHLSSGWPQRVNHSRTVKIEDGSQVDSLSFTRVTDS